MAPRLSPGDATGFKLLFLLAALYGLMSVLVYSVLHMKFITPLAVDAPPDRFSEARAVEHVRALTRTGRQEGRPGLREAANYIRTELEAIRGRSGSGYRIEIEETAVNGSFNMMFLGHSISLGYRNHTNLIMRMSSVDSPSDDASVLINGHFDSPLGSVGAGDCGSCVASMLEVARVIVDSGWIPPRPIIFLFNGAEELFMLAAHGFMTTHEWRHSIGASINVEASGTGGPDLVCQSGPSSWPSQLYAQSAIYPMAHSAAQDVFPIIPGDTDYRMFSQDYGNIPSLDIIFLLGGYYYHTSFDTVDKLLFARPYLAYMMFIPCSLLGLLIPRAIWSSLPPSLDASNLEKSKEALSDEARFWGAFGLYAVITQAYTAAGLSGGFLAFLISASMLLAWIFFCLSVKFYGHQTLRSTISYIIPLVPYLIYGVYFGAFLIQFLIEKTGMVGAVPPPYGYYVPDVLVAAVIGLVTSWCFGPLVPVLGWWLARSSILKFLLHITVVAMAVSSQFFPYSNLAPKRLVFQHTVVTTDGSKIMDSSYHFAVVDSNSLNFLFKHSPEVAKQLQIGSDFSLGTANKSQLHDWVALFPVSHLFSGSLKFPASNHELLKQYQRFPHLYNSKPATVSGDGSRRVHLELSLGDSKEVWVTVLNITGPLSSWSFADNKIPAPEVISEGPASFICRLSGSSHETWTFWLEASSSENLRVDVAVLDQALVDETEKLKGLFPDWVDVTAYTGFLSSYVF
ncbi:unnamed protein product [Linum tenue]|uniref:Peptidase M28 domain-containing protein n=1 Tax=Linum tenue TaxID=586396 RepID=A0AAV0H7J9_9ROSI|nr:unnamed protein product [Linum tenue]